MGAFQVGVEQVLREHYGLEWSCVAGQSVGSLNGAMIAMGKYQELEKLWKGLNRSDVYKKLTLWRILQVAFKHRLGLMSTVPLRNILRELNPNPKDAKIPFRFGAVDLLTSSYVQFTEKELSPDNLLASASIPIVFPPVGSLVDGGLVNNGPIGDVIPFDPDLIVVIPTKRINRHRQNPYPKNILKKAAQVIQIALDEGFRNDFDTFLAINNLVQQANEYNETLPPGIPHFIPKSSKGREFKHFDIMIVEPSKDLGGSLNFSADNIEANIKHGRDRAHALMQLYGF